MHAWQHGESRARRDGARGRDETPGSWTRCRLAGGGSKSEQGEAKTYMQLGVGSQGEAGQVYAVLVGSVNGDAFRPC